MVIKFLKNIKHPFWRVKYKDKVYCREERNGAIYWTIENIGQNTDLYKIQNELETIFHKTIRKDKLLNIMKSSYLRKWQKT